MKKYWSIKIGNFIDVLLIVGEDGTVLCVHSDSDEDEREIDSVEIFFAAKKTGQFSIGYGAFFSDSLKIINERIFGFGIGAKFFEWNKKGGVVHKLDADALKNGRLPTIAYNTDYYVACNSEAQICIFDLIANKESEIKLTEGSGIKINAIALNGSQLVCATLVF